MSDYQPITRETFIVRVWRESASGTWRGQIVHLPDQTSRYFATLAQATAFIQQYVPGFGPPAETDQMSRTHTEEEY